MRDALSLLPECDATKLSLSAQYFSGEEAMLCAQRQKSSSLAQLFEYAIPESRSCTGTQGRLKMRRKR